MIPLQSGNCAHESVTHDYTLYSLCSSDDAHSVHTDAHADINTNRLFFLHNYFGSCFSRSSSASRRILVAVVREQIHTSNLAFTSTLNMSHLNIDPRTVTASFDVITTKPYCSATLASPPACRRMLSARLAICRRGVSLEGL